MQRASRSTAQTTEGATTLLLGWGGVGGEGPGQSQTGQEDMDGVKGNIPPDSCSLNSFVQPQIYPTQTGVSLGFLFPNPDILSLKNKRFEFPHKYTKREGAPEKREKGIINLF